MKRRVLLGGLASAAIVAEVSTRIPRASANTTYQAMGDYLDYNSRVNIGNGSNVRFDDGGVIQVKHGSGYVYNPTTISQYGLQQFTYYKHTGSASSLHRAVVQAGWLVANQEKSTGRWNYDYAFGVGGMSETLAAGWASAMAQGQALSLLTRVYSVYPSKTAYLSSAKAGLAPLKAPVSSGGLSADFQGHTYLEEYPTQSAHTFALNGFLFTLVGLFDLSQHGSIDAQSLFKTCMQTVKFALPYHDMVTTSAYHLGHLTKPPRVVHHSASYHRVHVTLLDALRSVAPDDTLTFYADLWRGYPDMQQATASATIVPMAGAQGVS